MKLSLISTRELIRDALFLNKQSSVFFLEGMGGGEQSWVGVV